MIPIHYKSARLSTADTQTSERRVNARCLTCEDCWELEADRTVKDGIWAPNVCFFEGGLVQIPKRGGGRVERRLRRDAIAESLLECVELPPYVCTVRKGLRRMNFIHPWVDDVMQTLSTHFQISNYEPRNISCIVIFLNLSYWLGIYIFPFAKT